MLHEVEDGIRERERDRNRDWRRYILIIKLSKNV